MATADIEEIIHESLEDATLPDETQETSAETGDETPTESVETTPEATDVPLEASETAPEVQSPAAKTEPVKDDFEKKYGVPSQSVTGRENRIPYSRVKKITEKAVNDAKKEWEATASPKLTEFETKVKDYEVRLERVSKFEDVMVNKPDQFLQMLSTIPTYSQFFKAIEAAFSGPEQGQPAPVSDGMPEPDQELADGTKVYSMEGLRALNTWNRAEARKETLSEVERRFGPIESEWQARQRYEAFIPQVQSQIVDARTWPLFNENEDEIVKVLEADAKISLERAYQKVVYPKIVADRTKIREELLKELKQAPRATSAPSGGSKSSASAAPPGSRSLEDVIAEAVKTIK